MKLVKKFTAIVACATIVTASLGITSFAKPTEVTLENLPNFLNYSYNYRGTYSVLAATPLYAAVTSSDANYHGSEKYATYTTYTTNIHGTKEPQGYNSGSSTERTYICYIDVVPNGATTIREYDAGMYKGTLGSGTVDTYDISYSK